MTANDLIKIGHFFSLHAASHSLLSLHPYWPHQPPSTSGSNELCLIDSIFKKVPWSSLRLTSSLFPPLHLRSPLTPFYCQPNLYFINLSAPQNTPKCSSTLQNLPPLLVSWGLFQQAHFTSIKNMNNTSNDNHFTRRSPGQPRSIAQDGVSEEEERGKGLVQWQPNLLSTSYVQARWRRPLCLPSYIYFIFPPQQQGCTPCVVSATIEIGAFLLMHLIG